MLYVLIFGLAYTLGYYEATHDLYRGLIGFIIGGGSRLAWLLAADVILRPTEKRVSTTYVTWFKHHWNNHTSWKVKGCSNCP